MSIWFKSPRQLRNGPAKLVREYQWEVIVHLYEQAAQAGVKPINGSHLSYQDWMSEGVKDNPAYYTPDSLMFTYPPTRADVLTAWGDFGWAEHLLSRLKPLLDDFRNQWPILDSSHKAASSELFDNERRKVGHVDIWRREVYVNEPYAPTANVDLEAVDECVKPFKGERRDKAREVIDANANRIREKILAYPGGPTYDNTLREIRAVLNENGFKTSKRTSAA